MAVCVRALQMCVRARTSDVCNARVVMHRRTLYENVDSAKIKVPFYTTDINILRVASMHCIVSIHIDESLHP